MSTKRILHIVSAMDRGGAETLIMNVYRYLDRTRYQFDFVTHRPDKGDYEEEIERLGGEIYKIPSLGQVGPITYVKKLTDIMKSKNYVAVHSHTDYQSGFPALAARVVGIEHRICHAHSTNWLKGSKIKERLILKSLQTVIKYSATSFCSCSEESARFLFGNDIHKKGRASILKNGINITPFLKERHKSRQKLLKELNLADNVILVGHVGRFSESKNHRFLLKVLKKLVDQDDRFVALLVGNGSLKEQMIKEAEENGIRGQIKFLGVRADIPDLMNAFDVFLFPSLFEGFGIVTIEAQSAGTPCILSESVPKATDMGLGLVTFLGLDEEIEIWIKEIKKSLQIERPNQRVIHDQITKRGYNIQYNIEEWSSLYGA